jgi:hypothetical protein
MKKIALASLLTAIIPAISFAHPGHGTTGGYTIIHYFVEPQHAVITYGVFLVTAIYVWRRRRKMQRNENS